MYDVYIVCIGLCMYMYIHVHVYMYHCRVGKAYVAFAITRLIISSSCNNYIELSVPLIHVVCPRIVLQITCM